MMEQKPRVGRYKKWQRRRRDVVFTVISVLLLIAQVVMCIITHNFYHLIALSILGYILIGVAVLVIGGLSWYAVRRQRMTEDREWLQDTVLVDTGIYEIIRHPVYFLFMLCVLSLMLISQHWTTIILGIPVVAYLYWLMKLEEWANVDKFGEEYVDYMDRVPRMNIITGLKHYLKKRKERQY